MVFLCIVCPTVMVVEKVRVVMVKKVKIMKFDRVVGQQSGTIMNVVLWMEKMIVEDEV